MEGGAGINQEAMQQQIEQAQAQHQQKQ